VAYYSLREGVRELPEWVAEEPDVISVARGVARESNSFGERSSVGWYQDGEVIGRVDSYEFGFPGRE